MIRENRGDEANALWHPEGEGSVLGKDAPGSVVPKAKRELAGVSSETTEQKVLGEAELQTLIQEDPELNLRKQIEQARDKANRLFESWSSYGPSWKSDEVYGQAKRAKFRLRKLEAKLEGYLKEGDHPKPGAIDPGVYLRQHRIENDWEESGKTRRVFNEYEKACIELNKLIDSHFYILYGGSVHGTAEQREEARATHVTAKALLRTRLRSLGLDGLGPKEIEANFDVYERTLAEFAEVEERADTTEKGQKKRDQALARLREAEKPFIGSR